MCGWPALGMPWDTARANAAAFAVCSRCGGLVAGGAWGLVWAWAGGLQFGPFLGFGSGSGTTRQPQRTEPFHCTYGQPWACHGTLQGQMLPLQSAAGVTGYCLAGLGGWVRPGLVVWGLAHFWSLASVWHHSATTAHRALPVCVYPALGIPWDNATSNAACAACNRCGGACTGACGRGAVQVVGWRCGFAGLWSCPEEEEALINHSAQSPASVIVASPGHAVGHCNVKCSLYSVQQVWWCLCWGGAAEGLVRWFV